MIHQGRSKHGAGPRDEPERRPKMSIFREMWDKLGTPSTALRSPGNWNPKLPPARLDASLSSLYNLDFNSRETELGPDYAPLALTLGGHSLIFQEGQWLLQQTPQGAKGRSPKAGDRTRIRRLKNKNRELQEENNALKIRVELLMDMLAETTARLKGSDPGEGGSQDSLAVPQTPQMKRASFQIRSTKRKS
ncbi:protein chibby homolog 1-like [Oncorhynchus keta]|uniref:protein chibby homolog 1-like n=1 Tax=Oncorhynchus keta TaxID=8018 RepID=UPI00227B87D5|nr:protein chibby homolog 1-like [Oncorhynchus keta]